MSIRIFLFVLSISVGCSDSNEITCFEPKKISETKTIGPLERELNQLKYDPIYNLTLIDGIPHRFILNDTSVYETNLLTQNRVNKYPYIENCNRCMLRYIGDTMFIFHKSTLEVTVNSTQELVYQLPPGYNFKRSNQNNLVISPNFIVARINPVADYSVIDVHKNFIEKLKRSKIFVIINRRTGEINLSGDFPDVYPYNQQEYIYNRIEYNVAWDLRNDTIFFMYPFHPKIFTIPLKQNFTTELFASFEDCHEFNSLQNTGIIAASKISDKSKFLSQLNQIGKIISVNDSTILIHFVSGIEFTHFPTLAINRPWKLVKFNINNVNELTYFDMSGYLRQNAIYNNSQVYLLKMENEKLYYHIYNY